MRMYEQGGRRIEALYPDDREDKGRTRAIDEETALSLVNLKRELKDAPLPVILRQAIQRKILPVDFKVSPATLYRLFNQHGLMDEVSMNEDRRRFEAELPKTAGSLIVCMGRWWM